MITLSLSKAFDDKYMQAASAIVCKLCPQTQQQRPRVMRTRRTGSVCVVGEGGGRDFDLLNNKASPKEILR